MKKDKKEKEPKGPKIDGKKLFGRIIAILMVVMMLAGTFYNLIYLLINS